MLYTKHIFINSSLHLYNELIHINNLYTVYNNINTLLPKAINLTQVNGILYI